MNNKNNAMESAIQDRMEAHPEVLQMNKKGLKAYEKYLLANEELGKLKERKDSLTLDEQKRFEVLVQLTSEYEKTIEASRKALAEANAEMMKSA